MSNWYEKASCVLLRNFSKLINSFKRNKRTDYRETKEKNLTLNSLHRVSTALLLFLKNASPRYADWIRLNMTMDQNLQFHGSELPVRGSVKAQLLILSVGTQAKYLLF